MRTLKLAALAVAMISSLALVACGNDKNKTGQGDPEGGIYAEIPTRACGQGYAGYGPAWSMYSNAGYRPYDPSWGCPQGYTASCGGGIGLVCSPFNQWQGGGYAVPIYTGSGICGYAGYAGEGDCSAGFIRSCRVGIDSCGLVETCQPVRRHSNIGVCVRTLGGPQRPDRRWRSR